MASLRQKIGWAYFAIAALIVGLSLFVYVELGLMEEKMVSGERVSGLLNAVLEIRRFEKNHFLYRQPEDARENRLYLEMARNLFRDHESEFLGFSSSAEVFLFRQNLEAYAQWMTHYLAATPDSPQAHELEAHVRRAGKELVSIAERMAKSEQAGLRASLARHRISLAVSIVLLIVLAASAGQWLSRMVSRPLREMEQSMAAVARGGRDQVALVSQDREIVSLAHAINHLLQELEQRQRHLMHSEKLASLGTLLSGVAHELNNPLSNISTACQILLEEGCTAGPEFQRELLEQIDEQGVRARNIVRALLDFARDRAPRHEMLGLAALVRETLGFIKGQFPSQVEVVLAIPEAIVVQGDKQRLQQVFLNLLKNAAESLEGAGGIHVSACLPESDDEHRWPLACRNAAGMVEICVRDGGHGIPAELLPRVFDPFFTTRDVGKGSGLGLYVVHEIVEEHGGCVVVESAPGQGAAFFIRLPKIMEDAHR